MSKPNPPADPDLLPIAVLNRLLEEEAAALRRAEDPRLLWEARTRAQLRAQDCRRRLELHAAARRRAMEQRGTLDG